VIATAFADIGFDVDVGTLFQTPEEVGRQAIENDVHVIGVSTQSGGHKTLVPQLVEYLRKEGSGDIVVTVGGIIPARDYAALEAAGVRAIFGPGTNVVQAARRVLGLVRAAQQGGGPAKAAVGAGGPGGGGDGPRRRRGGGRGGSCRPPPPPPRSRRGRRGARGRPPGA